MHEGNESNTALNYFRCWFVWSECELDEPYETTPFSMLEDTTMRTEIKKDMTSLSYGDFPKHYSVFQAGERHKPVGIPAQGALCMFSAYI